MTPEKLQISISNGLAFAQTVAEECHMTKMTLILATMTLWGASAFANLPSAATATDKSDKDVQTISAWVKHLNHYNQDLNLSADLSDSSKIPQVMKELNMLESSLLASRALANGSLQMLACASCACVGCD